MAVWHRDPAFEGKFHPQYPDDVQVIVHEGSFRFTETKPELMWAKILEPYEVTDINGGTIRAYKAQLLNQPFNLKTIKMGSEILFIAPLRYRHPIRVTEQYLADRREYDIEPCNRCGLNELFDPISQIIEKVFPQMKEALEKEHQALPMFTSLCPVCGGVLIVKHKGFANAPTQPPSTPETFIDQVKRWFRRN